MSPSAAQRELADTIRGLLPAGAPTREVSMFGGRAFMVHNKMVVCAMRAGDLLVRIDPTRFDELSAHPGAGESFMGAGRSMGPSWLHVDAERLGDRADVAHWLDIALSYNRALTGRG